MAKQSKAPEVKQDAPKATRTETAGEPAPVVVPKAETKAETSNGIGGSPLAVPPRGFFGKPPYPGGIGHGNAR